MQHTQIDTRIQNWLFDLQNGKSVPMGSLDNFNRLIAQKSTSFSAIGMSREEVFNLWFENHRSRAELTFQEILASKPPNDGLKAALDQLIKVCESRHKWHAFKSCTDHLRATLTDLDSMAIDTSDDPGKDWGMFWVFVRGAQAYQVSFTELDISITELRRYIKIVLRDARKWKSSLDDDGDDESDKYERFSRIASQTFSSCDEELSCIAR